MDRYEKAMRLSDKDFKQIIGIKKETFEIMLEIIMIDCFETHGAKKGRHKKLSFEDILFMALKYYREYPTYKSLSFGFGVGEATVYDNIAWVEKALLKDGRFSLPGKKALLNENRAISEIIVDATESPIQRPKKNKKSTIPARKSAIQ